jgi:hypothetical protein
MGGSSYSSFTGSDSMVVISQEKIMDMKTTTGHGIKADNPARNRNAIARQVAGKIVEPLEFMAFWTLLASSTSLISASNLSKDATVNR